MTHTFHQRLRIWISLLGVVVLLLSTMGVPPTTATDEPAINPENHFLDNAPQSTTMVRLELPDHDALNQLLDMGIDLAEHLHEHEGEGYEVDAIVTEAEREELEDLGWVSDTIYSQQAWEDNLATREQQIAENEEILSTEDDINILRADYFTNHSGTFLYVEAKSSAGSVSQVLLTAHWTEGDEEHNVTLNRKVDAGEYMYHTMLVPVVEVPETVRVESSLGAEAEEQVSEWLGAGEPDEPSKHYVSDFIDHYMTPTELTERIESLAEEFPSLAEVVTLPHQSNGYRRHAQALFGTEPANAFTLTSLLWGHEGGNDITVEVNHNREAGQSLFIEVEDEQHIIVTLETDDNGEIVTTAHDLVEALNLEANDLVTASLYRQQDGKGIVVPQERSLSDNLNASEEISREPFDIKMLRIGRDRDGSKPGVFAYAQEHAREWVTPLVTIEAAERLLRNYAHDPDTRKLVDHLDIFLIPSVNPDGSHYSFYDYTWQRKNMTNYCDEALSDPTLRDTWGVDLNRNHEVGSIYNGYTGASTNCTSAVYAGPDYNSEPEARNLIWVAEQFPHISFAMNIHSYGGYFMWPPGAYKAEGRETLERPTAGQEAFFWAASEHILSSIQEHRGTVILPGRTGPIPDVLYSAAGNSADTLWYNHDIYAWNFEVGADLYDEEAERWRPVGFQPPFEEGHEEAMEFANGLISLFEVAYNYGKDNQPPKSSITPGKGTYDDEVEVTFETSEPATIYYTLDGSRPTFDSEKLSVSGLREGQETLTITDTTTIQWFAVDASGNIERNYDPYGNGQNFHSETITIINTKNATMPFYLY
ncbi:M14 family metallopeptidase [Caldalkalibacillus salinus]|uniref:M14 family metallopeptidase n=1 Tax=Caldalkalibacillus salinus TaxID=2803787 RepID=UPI0019209B24|nr:M14 family metallopeptidase [Caldalkalibacillus salinus]